MILLRKKKLTRNRLLTGFLPYLYHIFSCVFPYSRVFASYVLLMSCPQAIVSPIACFMSYPGYFIDTLLLILGS